VRRKNPHAATKSLKEIFAEDEALIGQEQAASPAGYAPKTTNGTDSIDIRLQDMINKLKELAAIQDNRAQGSQPNTTVEEISVSRTQVSVELKATMRPLERVEGLVRRSRELAETDRYAFEFSDPTHFKITDKWSARSTTIWGDPHVDTNDQEGDYNGEFSDLKESNSHTTLQLMDGTRVTFTARDNGVIEEVDIFKGSQHLSGKGAGAAGLTAENSLFAGAVDTASKSIPLGDVVRAGGDGNDWFDSSGKMVWGKTTGSSVISRPSYVLEMEYNRTIIQESSSIRRTLTA
jgi:hypothetical protein